MAYYTRNRTEDVSEAIAALRYSEMQTFARTLSRMAQDRSDVFPCGMDEQALADLLSDWAESIETEIREAMKDKD